MSEAEKTEAAEYPEETASKDRSEVKEKISRSIGWGVSAFQIIMGNKIVIAGCLLVQGLFYLFRPHGSLEWDMKILTGLTVIYAVVCIIFVLTRENETAKKSKDLVGGWYKGYWEDKHKQMTASGNRLSESLSDNELVQMRDEAAQERDERLKQFAEKKKEAKPKNKWLIIATYVVLIVICIPLFFFSSFTDRVVHTILGIIILIEGVFSVITVIKTKDSVRFHDRVVSLIIAIFSIALGVFLIVLPGDTAAFVIQIAGVGFILKAFAELWVGFRNRSLIFDTRDTISQIKNI